ncbi:hypothetical protein O0L34_g5481 [Tuta absoluta]|nr:hypothetical protein O0L34_g5481 [Tuta absoluta]
MSEDLMGLEYYVYNITEKIENSTKADDDYCLTSTLFYNSTFGFKIAVSEWEALATISVLCTVIIGTIFGNILVILGVFTYKPLRIVQNFFIVSLAVADLAVAILVMPLNVAYSILGQWLWGKHLCKIWLTSDIMCCTSSILNLCAIALDRYFAITDPIKYAHKRTLTRVVLQIAGVWILSLVISSPPLLGWNDWPDEFTADTPCQLTSEPGYVVYSSLGSFFIPLLIMTIVYIKIYIAAKQRLKKRCLAARIYKKRPVCENPGESVEKEDSENESDSGESVNRCHRKTFMDIKKNFFMPLLLLNDPIARQNLELDMQKTSSEGYKMKVVGSIRRISGKRRRQGKPLLASVNNSGDVVHQFIEQKQKISLSKERRAARTLGIIMGSFVVCWMPFFLMYILLPFCPWCCPENNLINFVTWLGYINSTLNPIIYTIFNLDFRRAFKKILGLNA